MIIIEMNLYCW